MNFHPIADIFPLMQGQEFQALCDDIRENGLLEAIWTHDGQIIDGRNRDRACEEVGVEPRFREWQGESEGLTSFVVSLNLKRRHLNESQRAMVAAKIANLEDGQKKCASPIGEPVTQQEAADLLNVSKRGVERAKQVQTEGTPELVAAVETGKVAVSTAAEIATLPKEEQEKVVAEADPAVVIARAKEIRKEKTDARKRERIVERQEREFPSGKYEVIYADPPWQYSNSGFDQSAQNQYPTMDTDAICNLCVRGVTAENAVLFLWATSPLLEDAFRVMTAWGFDYKASMIWVKNRAPGMGWFVQTYHEFLLIGVNAPSMQPLMKPKSIIEGEVSEHSRKPSQAYDLIEQMYTGPKVELFARVERDGWSSWGNEI